MSDEELIVSSRGRAGILQLNRPDALNALTHDMALEMEKALLAWRDDAAIDTVVVRATGERAFCAGGDIAWLYETGQDSPEPGRQFWRDEYRLNALIKNYPKPYVALMNGITMGGGVGVSAHGSHRVVTENTMVAMPEVSIGFLPDVGGTFLLSRARGVTGRYLGLTGARMNAADAIFAGFADYFVPADKLDELVELISDGTAPDKAIKKFSESAPEGKLEDQQPNINRAFGQVELKECIEELQMMISEGSEWAEKCLTMMKRNAPLAMACTYEALKMARGLRTLEECLSLEFNFAYRAIAGHDFLEGIRAMVIDKDRKPDWRPATLDEVTADMVDEMLAPLGDEQWKATS